MACQGKKKCIINAFVIMPNHIHLIWKIPDGFERKNVQGALFSFTAHEFKKKIKRNKAQKLPGLVTCAPALLKPSLRNITARTITPTLNFIL
jgi:REP element-mobilizing transposase RayT